MARGEPLPPHPHGGTRECRGVPNLARRGNSNDIALIPIAPVVLLCRCWCWSSWLIISTPWARYLRVRAKMSLIIREQDQLSYAVALVHNSALKSSVAVGDIPTRT